jgi:DNA-binding response OmpR family regulator
MNAAPTILLLEDDQATRTFLADNLAADGFEIVEAGCIKDAKRLLERSFPDVAIVDVALPDGNGLALISSIRDADRVASRVDPDLPVLVLSARRNAMDVLRGFRQGCDDFVGKPFSYPELLARVTALMRRRSPRRASGRLRVGPLELDVASRQVWVEDEPVHLSVKEFALLRVLATEPTRVFTRAELLESIWGFGTFGRTRTLDSHAARLRRKLNATGTRFVVNAWGVGYRLVDGGTEA